MKEVEILEGEPFDWKQGAEAMNHVQREDGSVNWRAAACADPGVIKCPKCDTYYWAEGTKVRCTECKHIWKPFEKQKGGA